MTDTYHYLFPNACSHENEAAYCRIWAPEGASKGLDLGCGDCKAAPWITGVDIHAGPWLFEGGLTHVSTPDVVADIRELPFEDESQDLVVSIHSLEHFADPQALLTEWARVIRPGGRLAIIVPDWRYTFSCNQDDQKASPFGHKMDYTLDILVKTVQNALPHMELVDARVVNYHWSVGVVLEKC